MMQTAGLSCFATRGQSSDSEIIDASEVLNDFPTI